MASLSQQLADAEAAYHDLQSGKATAEFRDSNGEMVRYTAADRSELRNYISDLKRQIAGTQQTGRAPMRPIFG